MKERKAREFDEGRARASKGSLLGISSAGLRLYEEKSKEEKEGREKK